MGQEHSDKGAGPMYRCLIREIDAGWWWRVEIDVRNGRAWSGIAESRVQAFEAVAKRLAEIEATDR